MTCAATMLPVHSMLSANTLVRRPHLLCPWHSSANAQQVLCSIFGMLLLQQGLIQA